MQSAHLVDLNRYHSLGKFSWRQIDEFLFFPESRIWHFMQIDKLKIYMKYQILFPGKIKKNISKCRLLKILLIVLSVKRQKKNQQQHRYKLVISV